VNKNHYQQFTATMIRFIKKIMAMDRAEKLCYGVTLSQAYTIGTIHEKEKLTMNELSQEMGLAISTLTRITDVLVRDDIVCRNQSVKDRRKVLVCLTDKGKELAEKLDKCGAQFWANIINGVPKEKREEVVENLRLLLNALEGADQACCHKNSS